MKKAKAFKEARRKQAEEALTREVLGEKKARVLDEMRREALPERLRCQIIVCPEMRRSGSSYCSEHASRVE